MADNNGINSKTSSKVIEILKDTGAKMFASRYRWLPETELSIKELPFQ